VKSILGGPLVLSYLRSGSCWAEVEALGMGRIDASTRRSTITAR